MGIDQAGQAGLVTEIQNLHARRAVRSAIFDGRNPPILNHDHTIGINVIRKPIDQGATSNRQIAAVGRERCLRDARCRRFAGT